MTRNLKLFLTAMLVLAIVSGTAIAVRADDHGRGGGGGHGGGGHGGGGGGGGGGHSHSQNFFGLGPQGFTYGYRNDNFGLLIGPVGGGQAQPYYAAPQYEPVVVSGPPVSYGDPGNGYGGWSQPAISAPIPASDALAYSGTTGSLAATFYRQSVDAFRSGDYAAATRFADHAIVEDSESGLLRTHAAQCLMATAEFDAAAIALNDGLRLLDQSQWGKEVKNFRNLYKRNDYVSHIKALEKFAADNPQSATGNALCVYVFHFLGHPDAALRHWQSAFKADPNNELVLQLAMLTGQSTTEQLPEPASVLVPSN